MQQLYVLRRFSSWSFRLSVSVALLISSAGLAASLLVGAAIANASVPHLGWQPTTQPEQPVSELGSSQLAQEAALPVSLSSMVPSYSFAANTAHAAPHTALASAYFAEQPVGNAEISLPTANTLKLTVQRSWHTFKLAFR